MFLSRLLLVLFCTSTLIHAKTNPSWTTSIAPFRIADNLYYVGSQELASYLIATPKREYPHQCKPSYFAVADTRECGKAGLPLD